MKENFNNDEIPFGKELKILQILLDFNLDKMAEIIFTTKASLIKLEKSANIHSISDDMLLKIYFATE